VQDPTTPVIIDVGQAAGTATEQVTVGDVLVGAFSFAGVIIVATVLLTMIFAGGVIWLRHRRRTASSTGEDTEATRLGLDLPSR
jgi:hypothetical protein